MKAITIHQPYATLIAIGAKHYETRSWSTPYRGPLIIHASRDVAARREFFSGLVTQSEFDGNRLSRPILMQAGYMHVSELPQGAALCVCDVTDCTLMTPDFIDKQTAQERAFGAWMPGRYAWKLENVREFPYPVPCRGMQKLWNFAIQLPPEFLPEPVAER